MGEVSVLIIDENPKELHQLGISLTGKGFTLATADNIGDVLKMFQLREVPQYIFLSDTIENRQELFTYLRRYERQTSLTINTIMISSNPVGRTVPSVSRPLTADKILSIIQLGG